MIEANILNVKEVVEKLYTTLPKMNGKKLAIITVGDDPASKIYVNNKIKACNRVGLEGVNYRFNPDTPIYEISNLIDKLNLDKEVIGIMIQKPLPDNFKGVYFENSIDARKDVDGLGSYNLYHTLCNREVFNYPATPKGIITLLDYYNIPIEGKNVCIIGRSDIVGKPLSAMMTARNASVTLCHSKTKNIFEYTQIADIIVCAIGVPEFLDSRYITCQYTNISGKLCKHSLKYPTIIDVGINRIPDLSKKSGYRIVGDVNFNDVLPYCGNITTVPGGVGLMTTYSLINNCCMHK